MRKGERIAGEQKLAQLPNSLLGTFPESFIRSVDSRTLGRRPRTVGHALIGPCQIPRFRTRVFFAYFSYYDIFLT